MSTVVYHNTPGESMVEIMRMLEADGLAPEVFDGPDAHSGPREACKGAYTVRIAVPDEQAERARSLIAELERGRQARVEGLARDFKLLVYEVVGFGGAVLCVLRLLFGSWEDIPWAYVWGGAIVLLAVIGNVKAIRRRRRSSE